MDKTRSSADALRGAIAWPHAKPKTIGGLTPKRFEQLYAEGARASGRLFRIHALPGSGLVGWATSRKIGCKPRRHRVRRRAQAALREHGTPETFDLIVVCLRNADQAPYAEIQEELRRLIEQLVSRWENG